MHTDLKTYCMDICKFNTPHVSQLTTSTWYKGDFTKHWPAEEHRPVWLRMWTLSVPLLANFCPQYGQIFSFSPVCVCQSNDKTDIWWMLKKNICNIHPHTRCALQSKMWSSVIARFQRQDISYSSDTHEILIRTLSKRKKKRFFMPFQACFQT